MFNNVVVKCLHIVSLTEMDSNSEILCSASDGTSMYHEMDLLSESGLSASPGFSSNMAISGRIALCRVITERCEEGCGL